MKTLTFLQSTVKYTMILFLALVVLTNIPESSYRKYYNIVTATVHPTAIDNKEIFSIANTSFKNENNDFPKTTELKKAHPPKSRPEDIVVSEETPLQPEKILINEEVLAADKIDVKTVKDEELIKKVEANIETVSPVVLSVIDDSLEKVFQAEIRGKLKQGDTFNASLRRQKVPEEVRSLVISNLSKELDFRRLKPSDSYTILLDPKGKLVRCTYESGPLDIYTVSSSNEGYQVKRSDIELERKTIRISGKIESSLFASFAANQEDMRLVYSFADIFASRIDFNTETHRGDKYTIVFDKYYKNGDFVGYGKIIAAAYYPHASGSPLEAYYFTTEQNIGSYFDADGQEVGASFIRSPLPVGRVTSKFTYSRKHPITGVVKPHLGVDLAAPRGTPIMASADGRITSIGRNGGNGLQVIIAHNGSYKSYYGHLSRFKKGLRKGSMVHKKDIIGYVGSTGMATGPHLDYRIQQHGVFKNPFAMEFKPKSTLKGQELANFTEQTKPLRESEISLIDFGAQLKVLQVSNLTITSSNKLVLL